MSSIIPFIPQTTHSIDWTLLMNRRDHLLNIVDKLPPYLLLPEIRAILHHVEDPNLNLLINTLWHTGARISEALTLTSADFKLDDPIMNFVKIQSLKKRKPKAVKVKKQSLKQRIVPLYSHGFKTHLSTYVKTLQMKDSDSLFPKVRFTYNKQFNKLQETLLNDHGLEFPIQLTPHVFRHSFAINCLINRISLSDIRDYLGHESIKDTEVYTKIFTGETHQFMQSVEF